MSHGIVDVFAFQEALLMEAVFGVALLAMIWAGFRRWLHHKERMDRLIAEHAAQYAAHIERVEARLKAVEQIVTPGDVETASRIDALPANPLPGPS